MTTNTPAALALLDLRRRNLETEPMTTTTQSAPDLDSARFSSYGPAATRVAKQLVAELPALTTAEAVHRRLGELCRQALPGDAWWGRNAANQLFFLNVRFHAPEESVDAAYSARVLSDWVYYWNVP